MRLRRIIVPWSRSEFCFLRDRLLIGTGRDARLRFEHAREMMRVIEAEHVCRFADAAAAHEDILRDSDDIRLDIFLGRSACGLLHQIAEITG